MSSVEYSLTIKELPIDERPRERLLYAGAPALSTTELLAIILRVGVGGESAISVAQRTLARFDGLTGIARASTAEIMEQHGIGEAKVAQIKAAFQLGRRLIVSTPAERPQVRSPADAAHLLMAEMALLEQEHLRLILLDTKNCVLSIPTIYVGSLNSNLIRIGELFRYALKENCAAIIVVHNHPSGDPTPSPEDVIVTRKMVEGGRLLDIEVLDHLVIGHGRFVSLKERRLGFS